MVSAFSGPQGKGALARHRAIKRLQADARNERTDPLQRRQYRLTVALVKALLPQHPPHNSGGDSA